MISTLPKVYGYCSIEFGSGDQAWVAICEDGRAITSHLSSSASWGAHDVGPVWKRDIYAKVFGEGFEIEYIALPVGELPPDSVFEANQKRAALEAQS